MAFKKGNIPWMKGKHHTEITKQKMSEMKKRLLKEGKIKIWNKGLKCPQFSGENNPFYGKHHAEETRKKLSKISKGKHYSPTTEFKKGIKSQMKEKTYDEIFGIEKANKIRKKMGINRRGKQAHLKNFQFKKGHSGFIGKHTEKTKRKISAIQQNIPLIEWKKFIGFEPYDTNFNNKFKRAIRKRDNQVCMLCGTHREKLTQAFHVHHINYDKKLSIPQNCISLCQTCHLITNQNREYWTDFFQELLANRYDYKYEDNKIKLNLTK